MENGIGLLHVTGWHLPIKVNIGWRPVSFEPSLDFQWSCEHGDSRKCCWVCNDQEGGAEPSLGAGEMESTHHP